MNRPNYSYAIRSVPRRYYNCGGFAMETFEWYHPGNGSWPPAYDETAPDLRRELTRACVEAMLEDFPDTLRVINNLSELREGEYAIAFRISTKDGDVDDFHFVKRGENHQWYEKRGNSRPIHRMKQAEVFSNLPWNGRYNGPTVLFAKVRCDDMPDW